MNNLKSCSPQIFLQMWQTATDFVQQQMVRQNFLVRLRFILNLVAIQTGLIHILEVITGYKGAF